MKDRAQNMGNLGKYRLFKTFSLIQTPCSRSQKGDSLILIHPPSVFAASLYH